MAKADLLKLFIDKIEEAIGDLDKDALADDINEAVDWSEIIKEIIQKDQTIKKKLKDKVAQLIGDKIEEAENFEDLTGDDKFDFLQHLPGGDDIGTFVSGLLEQGQPLRKKLEEKVVKLVGEQIGNAGDFEDLTGDSEFIWHEHLPEDLSFSQIIAELLRSDEELKTKLKDTVKELTLERIGDVNEDEMPDWEDFKEMLGISERIRKIIEDSGEINTQLTEKIRDIIKSRIEEGLDEHDLPDDFLKNLDIKTEVGLVLADRDFRAQISEQLQVIIRGFILQTVQSGDIGKELAEQVQGNKEFAALLDRQVSEMMRNPELIAGIKKTIKERLESDPEVGQKIMSAVFEEVARSIVGKLFKSY